MKYYIIAGEASGDLHGSNLMKGIYAEDPDAQIRFWGGDCMQSVWEAMESGTPGGIQDRATPLAAGGGAHEVGGVVLKTMNSPTPIVGNDTVFDCEVGIVEALDIIHLCAFQFVHTFW